MAFILEKISEEDKKKYNINPIYTSKWVIDENRNIYLLYNGGSGYGEVKYYELYLDGYIIKITAEEKGEPNKNDPIKDDVFYNIVEVLIPIHLKEKKDEVKNIITETLKTWGRFGNKKFTATVSVSFPQESDPGKIFGGIRFINSEKSN